MAQFDLQLLGQPRVSWQEDWLEPPPVKPFALLAYLACSEAWETRESLAFLFWPDQHESSAKRNLRQLVSRAKAYAFSDGVEFQATRLRWKVRTDVQAFRQALARQDWSGACQLYRGPLLVGLLPAETDGFATWLELEREALQAAWRDAVLRHAAELEEQGDVERCAALLKQVLASDSLAEDVVRRYMRCCALAGKRDVALLAFERFAQELQAELGAEPLEETLSLARRLRDAVPTEAPPPAPVFRRHAPAAVLHPPRLIGRFPEVTAIRAATTPLVALSGEAGSGKSRLLAELAPEALSLRAQEGLQAVPYFLFTSLIRTVLGQGCPLPELGPYRDDLARLVPELAPHPSALSGDPESGRARLFEALARFVEGLAPDDGFHLVADDLQWADEASLTALRYLLERGIRILAAYRLYERSPGLEAFLQTLTLGRELTEVRVRPLGQGETTLLLADLMGLQDGPVLFAAWLHKNTGGNPMLTLETLRSLFESGMLKSDENGWHSPLDEITKDYSELEVPQAVHEVIRRRVERLSDEARRVLQVAAVIGKAFHDLLLSRVVGLSDWAIALALEQAEAAGLIGSGQFRHDLLRQSVYEDIPLPRLRLLHAKVAAALGPEGDPLIIAEHLLRAEQPKAAIRLWREAAHRFRDRGLHAEALRVLERAVAHSDDQAQTWSLDAEQAATLREVGRHEDAEAIIGALLARCDLPETRAHALDTHSGNLLQQGRAAEAKRVASEGLHLAQQVGDQRLERSLTSLVAHAEFHLGRPQAALALLEPILKAQRDAAPDLDFSSHLTSVACIYDALGQPTRAAPLHHEAVSLARRLGAKYHQVNATLNLLYCYIELGRLRDAVLIAEEALALGRFEGTDTLRNNLAAAFIELDQWPEAARHCDALTKESSDPTLLCIAWSRLAEYYATRTKQLRLGGEALEQTIRYAQQTEFALAHARALVIVYRYGSQPQRRALAHVLSALDHDLLPAYMREQLKAALRRESS